MPQKTIEEFNKELKPCPKCGKQPKITSSRGECFIDTYVECSCGYSLECYEDAWAIQPAIAVMEWNRHIEENGETEIVISSKFE